MENTRMTKEAAMAELAKKIEKLPAERVPEVHALISGYLAGKDSAEEKQEAN